MKILIDARVASDHFTGIGRYAFGLARHLPRALRAHEFVAARNSGVFDTRFDWSALSGCSNLRVVECDGTGLAPADVLAFGALVHRERPDFVHAPYFTAALAHGVSTVVTLHDFIPFDAPRSGPIGLATRWGLSRTVRRAAHVVTPSQAVRDEGIRRFGLSRARVTAIPPGIQTPGDGPLPAPLLPGDPFILYVGVQKPHKNVLGLLEAHALAFRGAGMRLVVAGPVSSHTTALRTRAEALGVTSQVVFAGQVDEPTLGALLRNARALALVSFFEGFGVPMLEAMSVGTPVVASDRAVHREVCGDAAVYAKPEYPPSIALALREAVTGGEEREGRAARGRVRAAACNWEALAPRYAVCYESGALR